MQLLRPRLDICYYSNMDLGIRGKVAVVTACSSGLGKAVAQALAAEGVKLVLFARSADLLRTAAAEIEKQHNVPVLAVPGDSPAVGRSRAMRA